MTRRRLNLIPFSALFGQKKVLAFAFSALTSALSASALMGCGGSASETPLPLEPTPHVESSKEKESAPDLEEKGTQISEEEPPAVRPAPADPAPADPVPADPSTPPEIPEAAPEASEGESAESVVDP